MSGKTRDMTSGSPVKLMVSFAVPLMLGNIFQQLYTMTDAAIVGQFAGVTALGALGSADWLCWMIFGIVTGFTQGFSILIAQRFGAGDWKGLRRATATSIILGAIVAVIFTAIGFIMTKPVLRLLGTRKEFFDLAAAYLYILFGGMIVTTAYNLLSSMLRALGNSRVPLIAMVIASVTNIVLDFVFVYVFKWSVQGAAAATVIAQAVASAICLYAMLGIPQLRIGKGELRLDKADAKILTRMALPIASQNALISVGGMAVQYVINGLGFAYVAGFTATNKIYGLLEMAAISFGYAISTYTGQNLGAKNIKRIREGVNKALIIAFVTSLVIAGLMFMFGKYAVQLFIEKSADALVKEVAVRYLFYMAAALPILYFLYVYRSALQGMGNTLMPMLSGIAECVMRVGVAIILTTLIGKSGIYYAEPAAWLGAVIILLPSYYSMIKKVARNLSAP